MEPETAAMLASLRLDRHYDGVDQATGGAPQGRRETIKAAIRPLLACAAMCGAAFTVPASGQHMASPEGETAEGDIIVTATRRASPLSQVPIAMSAVTAQSLQHSGASDIRQLNQLVSSLLVYATGSEANASARIRGVGTVGDNPGLESSVAVFIDGVYRSRTGVGLNELGEIERVEVLRGPQGTVFGRNASAGLLNIVSKAPERQFGANAEVTYGNYDYRRLAGRITGPVTSSLALSLDGVRVKRNGFYDLIDSGGAKVGDTNDRDRWFVRGQALFAPVDALSVRIIGDYTKRDEGCCGAAYIETRERVATPGGGFTAAPANRIATILRRQGAVFPGDPYDRAISITPGRDYASKLKDWGVSGEIDYDLGRATLTSITAYRDYHSRDSGDYDYNTADLLYRDPGTFRRFKTFTQELRLQGSAFGGRLDWLAGGYYANERLTLRDNIVFGADYGAFTACRLLAGAGAVSTGLENMLACDDPATLRAQIAAIPGIGANPILRGGLQALASITGGTGDVDSRYFQRSENYAVFTHNIVHLTDRLDLTLGVRYTHERKRFSADLDNNNAVCPALQARTPGTPNDLYDLATGAFGTGSALARGIFTLGCLGNGSTALSGLDLADGFRDGRVSGTGVLSWRPMDDLMLYGSYSRGYKAGGYNLDRFALGATGLFPGMSPLTYFSPRSDADAASLRFAAETVDAFELGLKFNRRHWGVNIAAFRQAFSNFQLNTFNGFSFVVQTLNGCDGALSAERTCDSGDVSPGLVSQGVELELNASPVRDLRVTGGMTYARARFADRLVGGSKGAVPLDPALFLLPGSINSSAPQVVTTASIAWTPDIGSSGLGALLYVDGRMTGDYNSGSDLFPEKRQDGYAVVNARIGIRGPQQRWAVELWGQNIFNQNYTQLAFSSPLQGSSPATATTGQFAMGAPMANQLISAYLAEPRTYGVTLRGRF
jgi:iron complex outermembrane receptor protein